MKIYTFYKKSNKSEYIRISAMTYLEAIMALKELNEYAPNIYDLKYFKTDVLNIWSEDQFDIYCNILNIDTDYKELPYFVSNKQYKKISNWLGLNKDKKVIDKSEIPENADPILTKLQHVLGEKNINTFVVGCNG